MIGFDFIKIIMTEWVTRFIKNMNNFGCFLNSFQFLIKDTKTLDTQIMLD